MWQTVGQVDALWVRQHRHDPPDAVLAVEASAGAGIRGDCHADALSPRQLLITSTGAYRRLQLPAAALRENVTVSSEIRHWRSGALVRIGSDVVLWVVMSCEPCARLNHHRPGLARAVGNDRGVLCRVIRGGVARVGEETCIWPDALAPWSDLWQDRVRWIADAVPEGCVIEYAQLARLAGVPLSYCRTFPRILPTTPNTLHRRAVAYGEWPEVPRWDGTELFVQTHSALSQC